MIFWTGFIYSIATYLEIPLDNFKILYGLILSYVLAIGYLLIFSFETSSEPSNFSSSSRVINKKHLTSSSSSRKYLYNLVGGHLLFFSIYSIHGLIHIYVASISTFIFIKFLFSLYEKAKVSRHTSSFSKKVQQTLEGTKEYKNNSNSNSNIDGDGDNNIGNEKKTFVHKTKFVVDSSEISSMTTTPPPTVPNVINKTKVISNNEKRLRWWLEMSSPLTFFFSMSHCLYFGWLKYIYSDVTDKSSSTSSLIEIMSTMMILVVKITSVINDTKEGIYKCLEENENENENEDESKNKNKNDSPSFENSVNLDSSPHPQSPSPSTSLSKNKQYYYKSYYDYFHEMRPLKECPSALSFFSYIWFFVGQQSGPISYFNEFREFCERTPQPVEGTVGRTDNSGLSDKKIHSLSTATTITATTTTTTTRSSLSLLSKWKLLIKTEQFKHGFRQAYEALLHAAIFLTFCKAFHLDRHLPEFIFHYSLPLRLVYFYFVIVIARQKFYFAWKFSEGVSCLIGLSYSCLSNVVISQPPYDDDNSYSMQWHRLKNIYPKQIELSQDLTTIIRHWNTFIQLWLRLDVFEPILKATSNRTLAHVATFFISALWHGFYPGYFCIFVTGAFVSACEKKIFRKYRRYLDPKENPNISIRIKYLRILLNHLILIYMTPPFLLLDLSLCLKFWQSFYFYGHFVILIILLFL